MHDGFVRPAIVPHEPGMVAMSADSARKDVPKTGPQEQSFDRAKMAAKADGIAQQLSALKGVKNRAESGPAAEAPRSVYETPPASETQPPMFAAPLPLESPAPAAS